jgi:transcriptional regulator with XRE-family HTH domain
MNYFKENLKFLREKVLHLNQEELAEKLGITQKNIASYEQEKASMPKPNLLCKISALFGITINALLETDLAKEWDMVANDPMHPYRHNNKLLSRIKGEDLAVRSLYVSEDEMGKELIEMVVGVTASAGYPNSCANADFIQKLPKFRLPFLNNETGTFRGFEIKGDSMIPIPSGTIVVGRYVENWASVKNGNTHIIISREQGILFKRVYNHLIDKGYLLLLSDNPAPEYDPYIIGAADIIEIWETRSLIINGSITGDTITEKLLGEIAALRLEIKQLKGKNALN